MSRVRARLSLSLGLFAGCVLLAGCGAGTPAAAAHWAQPGTPSAADPGSAAPSPSGSPSGGSSSAPPVTGALDLRAVNGKTIVIDAGHNGGNGAHPEIINKLVPMGTGMKACDTTGTETNSGYQEAAFTFDVALRLESR